MGQGGEQQAVIYHSCDIWVTRKGGAGKENVVGAGVSILSAANQGWSACLPAPHRSNIPVHGAPQSLHANTPSLSTEFRNPFPAASLCFHSLNYKGEFSLHHQRLFLLEDSDRAATLLCRGFFGCGWPGYFSGKWPCASQKQIQPSSASPAAPSRLGMALGSTGWLNWCLAKACPALLLEAFLRDTAFSGGFRSCLCQILP